MDGPVSVSGSVPGLGRGQVRECRLAVERFQDMILQLEWTLTLTGSNADLAPALPCCLSPLPSSTEGQRALEMASPVVFHSLSSPQDWQLLLWALSTHFVGTLPSRLSEADRAIRGAFALRVAWAETMSQLELKCFLFSLVGHVCMGICYCYMILTEKDKKLAYFTAHTIIWFRNKLLKEVTLKNNSRTNNPMIVVTKFFLTLTQGYAFLVIFRERNITVREAWTSCLP